MKNLKTDFGKLSPWNWLLFTQVFEVFSAQSKHHRAEELADIISVCMEYIETLGYDPVQVYSARIHSKEDQLDTIFRRYTEAYKSVRRETRRW